MMMRSLVTLNIDEVVASVEEFRDVSSEVMDQSELAARVDALKAV